MSEKAFIPKDMSPEARKERLLKHQEDILAQTAKQFLEEDRPQEALALIRQANKPSPTNLLTLANIQLRYEGALHEEARELFDQYVERIDWSKNLITVLARLKKQTEPSVPETLTAKLEARIRELDPEWREDLDVMFRIQKGDSVPPESIIDPELCLSAAAQGKAGDKALYLKRYIDLGGNPQHEKYLQIRLNSILHGLAPPDETKNLIQQLSHVLPSFEFRKWLRANSQKESRTKKVEIPEEYARIVLASYIAVDPSELAREDWTHIGRRAIELGEHRLEQICYEYLKGIERDNEQQSIFGYLQRKFSTGATERASPADRQYRNPVYEQFGARRPVDRGAAIDVATWARDVLNQ